MAAVRCVHITVPSGATVITSDPSKYWTGPKSGIRAEAEGEEKSERCVITPLHRCTAAPLHLTSSHTEMHRATCAPPCTPLPSSWQKAANVWDLRPGNTTVQQGWEASLAKAEG